MCQVCNNVCDPANSIIVSGKITHSKCMEAVCEKSEEGLGKREWREKGNINVALPRTFLLGLLNSENGSVGSYVKEKISATFQGHELKLGTCQHCQSVKLFDDMVTDGSESDDAVEKVKKFLFEWRVDRKKRFTKSDEARTVLVFCDSECDKAYNKKTLSALEDAQKAIQVALSTKREEQRVQGKKRSGNKKVRVEKTKKETEKERIEKMIREKKKREDLARAEEKAEEEEKVRLEQEARRKERVKISADAVATQPDIVSLANGLKRAWNANDNNN